MKRWRCITQSSFAKEFALGIGSKKLEVTIYQAVFTKEKISINDPSSSNKWGKWSYKRIGRQC